MRRGSRSSMVIVVVSLTALAQTLSRWPCREEWTTWKDRPCSVASAYRRTRTASWEALCGLAISLAGDSPWEQPLKVAWTISDVFDPVSAVTVSEVRGPGVMCSVCHRRFMVWGEYSRVTDDMPRRLTGLWCAQHLPPGQRPRTPTRRPVIRRRAAGGVPASRYQ